MKSVRILASGLVRTGLRRPPMLLHHSGSPHQNDASVLNSSHHCVISRPKAITALNSGIQRQRNSQLGKTFPKTFLCRLFMNYQAPIRVYFLALIPLMIYGLYAEAE